MPTYYVRASGGSNGNDGLSFANAFATINHALYSNGVGNSLLTAGDEVRICADGEHVITSEVMLNTASGVLGSPITTVGANALGVVDGTRPIIRPTTAAITKLFSNGVSGTVIEMKFKNLQVLGKDSVGTKRATILFNLTGTNTSWRWRWENCHFQDAIDDNVKTRGSIFHFLDCTSTGAGGFGFGQNSTSDSMQCINTHAYGNDEGFYGGLSATTAQYFLCSAYNNTSNGWNFPSGGPGWVPILNGCVAYGNGGSGLRINHSVPTNPTNGIIANCSFVNNGSYGLELSNVGTSDAFRQLIGRFINNHHYGNTSGPTVSGDWDELNYDRGTNIAGDPLFVDAPNGDFRLLAASPLVGSGINGFNIGVHPSLPTPSEIAAAVWNRGGRSLTA